MASLSPPEVRETAKRLYNDLSAVCGSIENLCISDKPCSSLVIATLLRTLLECCISIFAFCRSPTARALLYLQHRNIIRLKALCAAREHIGCPVFPKSTERVPGTLQALNEIRQILATNGADFLDAKRIDGKDAGEMLKQALIPGKEKPNWFRDRWYPESRSDILKTEGLGYLYVFFYRGFCSAVHADTMGAEMLAGLDRNHAVFLSLMLWGCALYRMAETFKFRMPAEYKNLLRNHFYGFLHWPHGSEPRTQQDIDKRREQIPENLGSV